VFGKLATIRKVPTNKEVPLDLRNHVIKHPELGTTLCVIVEYEKSEDAQVMTSLFRFMTSSHRDISGGAKDVDERSKIETK